MQICSQKSTVAATVWLAAAATWGAEATGAGIEVASGGVRMELAADGAVANVSVGGERLQMPRPGGFRILDCGLPAGENPAPAERADAFVPVRGTLQAVADGARFQAAMPDAGLSLEAVFSRQESCLRIDGTILDTTGRDRAVAVRFAIPWDATGWDWSHDTEERQRIEPGEPLRRTYKCQSGFGECSIYPWASVSGADAGLSLAIPIDQGPRVFLLQHDPTSHELSVTFFFGLCADAARHRSRGPFSILLFSHDPAWGMRSTLDRYYRLFPAVFAKRHPHEAYLNYGNLERFDPATHELVIDHKVRIPDASDFGEGYVHLDHVHGCYQYMQTTLGNPSARPSDAEVVRYLASPAGVGAITSRRYVPVEEFEKRLVYDAEERIAYIGDTKFFAARQGYNQKDSAGWGLNFRVNEDPDISPFLAARAWDRAAAHTRSPNRRPWDAMFSADAIDGYFSNSQCLDHRREHFKTTLVPLTFDAQIRKPALSNMIWDFLHKAWWPITAKGQLVISGNANTYEQLFTAPYTDILLLENDWDVKHPGRLDRYVRAIYGRKLCRYWRVWNRAGGYGEQEPENVFRHFNRGVAYGIFPSVYGTQAAPGGIEPYRAAYREHVPVLEKLSAAGWEPVPYARATNGVVVERFGSYEGGNLYFTLRNYTPAAVETLLTLEREGLGVMESASLRAVAILPMAVGHVTVPTDPLPISIAAEGTVVVWVGTVDQASQRAFLLADMTLQRVQRTFGDDFNAGKRGTFAKWSQARSLVERGRQAAAGSGPGLARQFDDAVRGFERDFTTSAQVDLAKLLASARVEASRATHAAIGVESRTPRGPIRATPGQAISIPWRIQAGGIPIEITSARALTPWPQVPVVVPTRSPPAALAPSEHFHAVAEMIVPTAAPRQLIPVELVLEGRAAEQPFRISTVIDVVIGEH
jgi:hypothetical protein